MSWQGNPAARTSIGGTVVQSTAVMSPRLGTSGQWWARMAAAPGSGSANHAGSTSRTWATARSSPPYPEQSEPRRSLVMPCPPRRRCRAEPARSWSRLLHAVADGLPQQQPRQARPQRPGRGDDDVAEQAPVGEPGGVRGGDEHLPAPRPARRAAPVDAGLQQRAELGGGGQQQGDRADQGQQGHSSSTSPRASSISRATSASAAANGWKAASSRPHAARSSSSPAGMSSTVRPYSSASGMPPSQSTFSATCSRVWYSRVW